MAFRHNLKALRVSLNMTQEELGKKLDVSIQTIIKYEKGESTPDLPKLLILSKLFDISIDELVQNESKEKLQKDINELYNDLIHKYPHLGNVLIKDMYNITYIGKIYNEATEEDLSEFKYYLRDLVIPLQSDSGNTI